MGEWVSEKALSTAANYLLEYERMMREMVAQEPNEYLLSEWYKKVNLEFKIEHVVKRLKWLNEWLPKCSNELDSAYEDVQAKKKDSTVDTRRLRKYAPYWYAQEFKYNRMLEEKTLFEALLRYSIAIESGHCEVSFYMLKQ